MNAQGFVSGTAVALAWLCASACGTAAAQGSMPVDPEFVEGEPEVLPWDWLCVPGVRVGPVTGETSIDSLIALFGEEQVITSRVWTAEGTIEVWASRVLPGSDDELDVYWQEGDTPERIGAIVISGPLSRWHTEEGVHIGTTLDELNELNGMPFLFYGFDWDYGGCVSDWCGGALDGLALRLGYGSGYPEAYIGDTGPFSSDDDGLAPFDVVVREMTFSFY